MILKEPFEKTIDELNEDLKKSLTKLKNLSNEEKGKKIADIKKMMEHYLRLSGDMEDRRSRLAETSWQSMLIIFGVFTILFSMNLAIAYKTAVGLFALFFLIMQIIKIREFYEQANISYPFIKIPGFSNKWKWFYYGNKYITEISPNPFHIKNTFDNDNKYYLAGLNLLVNNYFHEDLDSEIIDDVQQLFLFQVHNYYKNRFYKRLLDIEQCTFNKSPIILIIILISLTVLALVTYYQFPNLFNQLFFVPDANCKGGNWIVFLPQSKC